MNENEDPPGSSLSRLTTPTWEMELLISGVTVFALLQLPGVMDEAYLALRPRLDLDWEFLCKLLFTYSKMGVLILAAAFVLHLALRGFWIALVGMNSIYPDGVIWDRLKIGPIQRRLIERRGISMVDRIERADNRASIVFALGITMALVMVGLILTISVSLALCALLSWLTGWDWVFPGGTFLLLTIIALPYPFVHFIDRRFGARLSADGLLARTVGKVFSTYARFGFGGDINPTMRLLQSHVGARKVFAATFLSIFLVGSFTAGQLTLQQGNIAFGEYSHWPDVSLGAPDSVIEQHYRDQADSNHTLLPTIDSMFPSGAYLSLIVPFNPKRHPALLAATCPTTWQAATKPEQRATLLDCMGRLQELTLDGQPMSPLPLRYYADPRTEQHAVLIVVPIGNLAPGEHNLSLKRPQDIDDEDREEEPDRYRIAFWK